MPEFTIDDEFISVLKEIRANELPSLVQYRWSDHYSEPRFDDHREGAPVIILISAQLRMKRLPRGVV